MALAGRSSRSGGGRRLLILALIVTILVVLLDASLKSRSSAPTQTLDGQMWIDRVLPLIATSTEQGRAIQSVRTTGLGMPASAISATLAQAAKAAAVDYRSVAALRSPAGAGGAPGLLQACLLVRSEAAQSAATAMDAALSAPTPASITDPTIQAMATAGRDFQIADRAYQLFAANIPRSLGVAMPASTWVPDASQYDPAALQAYLLALRNATSLQAIHQITIQAVTTTPPPVTAQGGLQQIPPTKSLYVSVVVADTGNQPERNLTVTAAVSPAANGTTSSVRDFIDLTAGTSHAVTIGPILPLSGSPATLTVTVTPGAGSATAPASTTLQLEVAAPPPPSTTTTSTTVPAGSSSSVGSSTTSTTGAG